MSSIRQNSKVCFFSQYHLCFFQQHTQQVLLVKSVISLCVIHIIYIWMLIKAEFLFNQDTEQNCPDIHIGVKIMCPQTFAHIDYKYLSVHVALLLCCTPSRGTRSSICSVIKSVISIVTVENIEEHHNTSSVTHYQRQIQAAGRVLAGVMFLKWNTHALTIPRSWTLVSWCKY